MLQYYIYLGSAKHLFNTLHGPISEYSETQIYLYRLYIPVHVTIYLSVYLTWFFSIGS